MKYKNITILQLKKLLIINMMNKVMSQKPLSKI